MGNSKTESMHDLSNGLDLLQPEEILSALLEGQAGAVASVRQAVPEIIIASSVAANVIRSGGKLIYAAAGSSGLMAHSDALELPGTFGIGRDRIKILFAGGTPSLETFFGGPEDDDQLGVRDVKSSGLSETDCLIAVSASGSTPYAVGALQYAAECGARTIAIANNQGSPLLKSADTAIFLPTPPELIAGSTRMGAGTAQKIALNMMSTLMAVELGHVVDGHMVNLIADNKKLKSRAARIIATLGSCEQQAALDYLDRADGSVKVAILLAAGAPDKDAAGKILENSNQNVRSALTELDQGEGSVKQRA
jgi:N-acetylmuramic acid 6-phosphate etherase